MINCCNSSSSGSGSLCFRVPASYLASERLPLAIARVTSPLLLSSSSSSILPGCRSCARAAAAATVASIESNLLHAAPLKHDPYTPDSMDSPSPNAINVVPPDTCTTAVPTTQQQQQSEHQQQHYNHRENQHHPQANPVTKLIQDRAVSPALLKSKLELIVQRDKRNHCRAAIGKSGSASASNSNSDLEEVAGNAETIGVEWCARKSRSNSDVSWQRSHLLTRAWLQGKGQQAYHSFSSDLHRTEDASSADDRNLFFTSKIIGSESQQQQQQHHHHHHHHQSEQCQLENDLIIPRIAIINASNFESNASSVHLHDDVCVNAKRSTAGLGNVNNQELLSDQYLDTSCYSNTRTKSLSSDSPGRSPAALTLEEDETFDVSEEEEEEEVEIAIDNDVYLPYKIDICEDHCLNKSLPDVIEATTTTTTTPMICTITTIATTTAAATTTSAAAAAVSKNTSRSNSIQSQEAANSNLKLKAYNKVTERCKRNIVGKKSRCQKCCVLS